VFYEILLEGVLKGIAVAVLAANLLLPLIHYATKSTLTDGRKIAFGIPAKLWIATGALILLFGIVYYKEFYLIAVISTFLLGLTAYLYLRRPLKTGIESFCQESL